MSLSLHIEVAIDPTIHKSQKIRGDLLEKLGSESLKAMQFNVVEEVRLTGMEVDLLAQHSLGNQKIYVECKAHRDNISAPIIHQLLGKLAIRDDINAVWLICTSDLGKDAKGTWEEWRLKPDLQAKSKLHIYAPQDLLNLLISVGKIIDPSKASLITLPNGSKYSQSAMLLVTPYGRYWCFSVINLQSGIPSEVHTFDAITGLAVTDPALIKSLSSTDSSMQELSWVTPVLGKQNTTGRKIDDLDLQSVVKVPIGDGWDDYRPSRPVDFVGRAETIKDIFSYFEMVRTGSTSTRLLSIKSPSGWGKSSLLVKLAEQSSNIRNKNKFYIYPVDTRAASSARYPELALVECLKSAIKDSFIEKPQKDLILGPINSPFEDESLKEILSYIKESQKVIIVFFDQFEEIFSKPELENLFKRFSDLCHAIDAAKENIVLGFSWKTDSTVPTDHQAYFMWNSLADRRKEFTVGMFDSSEVRTAINKFSIQLNEKVDPRLRRYLGDHCQGYPWLLKKLCIHIYKMLKSGKNQNDVIGQKLNIYELFKEEISPLQPHEYACVEAIAKSSPANYFEILEVHGSLVIESLIAKRLVIRSAAKLTLYWDIFKDFVLKKSVPSIPITYIPSYHIQAYASVLKNLMAQSPLTLNQLALKLGNSERTTDNIVRDMVMVGNARREGLVISAANQTEDEAISAIREYGRNHIFYKSLHDKYGFNNPFTNEDTRISFIDSYSISFDERTIDGYVTRMIGWLSAAGLMKYSDGKNELILPTQSVKTLGEIAQLRRGANARSEIFTAPAPPEAVILLLQNYKKNNSFDVSASNKNALEAASSLRLIHKVNKKIVLDKPLTQGIEETVLQVAMNHPSIQWAVNCLESSSTRISGSEMGELMAVRYGFKDWSSGSKKRCGGSLRRWADWVIEKTSNQTLF